ncbi:isopeptide-forming domain-containing fimbrial protein [Streptomyces fractus]|uniref:DUF7927 domain-containing protein n=1 Tax=Streptomyces fractus TaxID=641806 RepID=UPI003CF6D45C
MHRGGESLQAAWLRKLVCVMALGAALGLGAAPPSAAAPRAGEALTITKDAEADPGHGTGTAVRPGGTVTYRVRVTNNGATDYTGAVVKDDLSGVLDDASYNGDAKARSGSVSVDEPTLTWSGDVPAGRTVTITYSVTVDDPDTGDQRLDNGIVGPADSNCAEGSTAASCHWSMEVSELSITKSSDVSEAEPGDTVTYTVRVDSKGDSGFTHYDQILRDDLSGALDDATYNHDAKVVSGPGRVSYTEPDLDLLIPEIKSGESTVITYSMTVDDPDDGDHKMTNTVASPVPDGLSNCQVVTEATGCSADVTVTKPQPQPQPLDITKTSDAGDTVAPGDTVHYKITVSNPGTSDRKDVTFSDPLTDVLDDADYNGDAVASSGSVAYDAPDLNWSGDVPAGKSVTLTYSATVHDPDNGDQHLNNTVTSDTADTNCAPASTDPHCSTGIKVVAESGGGSEPTEQPRPGGGQLAATGDSDGTPVAAGIAVCVLLAGTALTLAATRIRRSRP